MLFLFGAIAAVLLIACSNLANLSLSRDVAGCAKRRFARRSGRAAADSSALRLPSSSCWRSAARSESGSPGPRLLLFVRTAPIDLPRVNEIALDEHVLVFAALMSVGTGLLVAILPAWRGVADAQATLRSGGATAVAGERGGCGSNALLALQVGLSVTLLVVTTRSAPACCTCRGSTQDFAAEVLPIDVPMPAARYSTKAVRLAAFDRLLARGGAPRTRKGLDDLDVAVYGRGQVNFIVPEGDALPRSEQASANFRFVAPDYFRTLGLSCDGADVFTRGTRLARTPALVSEDGAARLWPGEDPIGKRFTRGIEREPGFEVIGVANHARTTSLERESPLMVYLPVLVADAYRHLAPAEGVGRTRDVDGQRAAYHRGIRPGDCRRPNANGRAAGREERSRRAATRLRCSPCSAWWRSSSPRSASTPITAYGVSRRRREMNIRAALGARTSEVRAMIVWATGPAMIIGIVGGIAGAIALSSVVRSLLFDVGATDPRIIAAVVSVVSVVGVTTAAIAARRNASIDPAAALREP